ncbi:hypothetical protein CEXT_87261 [Caerostris extrusa]|uniref:Uncharacterized protein n=1 Tax=Caerostris extrusa TaxID=172846 RepID=A0AAV4T6D2_CAEEX|nr:hypothetical protein CEXT_87261 [Caerostris extrusa]
MRFTAPTMHLQKRKALCQRFPPKRTTVENGPRHNATQGNHNCVPGRRFGSGERSTWGEGAESGKGKDLSGMSCAGKGRGRQSQIRQDGRRSRLFVDTLQEQHCCSSRLDKTSRVPGGLGNFRLPPTF